MPTVYIIERTFYQGDDSPEVEILGIVEDPLVAEAVVHKHKTALGLQQEYAASDNVAVDIPDVEFRIIPMDTDVIDEAPVLVYIGRKVDESNEERAYVDRLEAVYFDPTTGSPMFYGSSHVAPAPALILEAIAVPASLHTYQFSYYVPATVEQSGYVQRKPIDVFVSSSLEAVQTALNG